MDMKYLLTVLLIVNTNEWQRNATRRDASETFKIFFDGTQDGYQIEGIRMEILVNPEILTAF